MDRWDEEGWIEEQLRSDRGTRIYLGPVDERTPNEGWSKPVLIVLPMDSVLLLPVWTAHDGLVCGGLGWVCVNKKTDVTRFYVGMGVDQFLVRVFVDWDRRELRMALPMERDAARWVVYYDSIGDGKAGRVKLNPENDPVHGERLALITEERIRESRERGVSLDQVYREADERTWREKQDAERMRN